MFNNNSYMNNQYTPYMGYTQPYMAYQQQMQQARQQMPMQQPQQEMPQHAPFSQILYGTYDQAKGHIAGPNGSVMFIDPDKSEVYIRKGDALGKQTLEGYKYYSLDKSSNQTETKPTEQENFVKPEQLKDFLTSKDIEGFITRKDLEEIYKKLEQIQKKIQINKVIEEETK